MNTSINHKCLNFTASKVVYSLAHGKGDFIGDLLLSLIQNQKPDQFKIFFCYVRLSYRQPPFKLSIYEQQ